MEIVSSGFHQLHTIDSVINCLMGSIAVPNSSSKASTRSSSASKKSSYESEEENKSLSLAIRPEKNHRSTETSPNKNYLQVSAPYDDKNKSHAPLEATTIDSILEQIKAVEKLLPAAEKAEMTRMAEIEMYRKEIIRINDDFHQQKKKNLPFKRKLIKKMQEDYVKRQIQHIRKEGPETKPDGDFGKDFDARMDVLKCFHVGIGDFDKELDARMDVLKCFQVSIFHIIMLELGEHLPRRIQKVILTWRIEELQDCWETKQDWIKQLEVSVQHGLLRKSLIHTCAICKDEVIPDETEGLSICFCKECKCYVCSNCSCQEYHLSFQEQFWSYVEEKENQESMQQKQNAAKRTKRNKKRKQKSKQKKVAKLNSMSSSRVSAAPFYQPNTLPERRGDVNQRSTKRENELGESREQPAVGVDFVQYLQQSGSIIALAQYMDELESAGVNLDDLENYENDTEHVECNKH